MWAPKCPRTKPPEPLKLWVDMSDFIPFLKELLQGLGPVTSRRMFGGHGLYCEGLMFAIVMDNRLYLKADETNRPDFEGRGLSPFSYSMKGKTVALSYWAAPDSVFDEPAEAVRWALLSWEAAARRQAVKAKASEKAKARRRS